LMGIWLVSTFWSLWIKLPLTCVSKLGFFFFFVVLGFELGPTPWATPSALFCDGLFSR
jgi:hypothetical protein